jgi:hypothetical protein
MARSTQNTLQLIDLGMQDVDILGLDMKLLTQPRGKIIQALHQYISVVLILGDVPVV